MRVILAYLLMSQLLLGLGVKSFVVIQWKINQEEIIEKYCVNKDIPMMNCNGKCYLSKQLKKLEAQEKEDRKNNPNPTPLVENTNFAWILKHTIPIPVIYTTTQNHRKGVDKPVHWYNRLNYEIDHPPQV